MNIKVLLVEDNLIDTKIINDCLKESRINNYTIENQTSLSDAINYIKTNPDKIDIILLDLILPDSMGITTLFEIQKFSKNIPIIVITGLSYQRQTTSFYIRACNYLCNRKA